MAMAMRNCTILRIHLNLVNETIANAVQGLGTNTPFCGSILWTKHH